MDSRPDLFLRLSNDEIDEHLADIDGAFATLHKGPFSLLVFSRDTTVRPKTFRQQVLTRPPSQRESTSSNETTLVENAAENPLAMVRNKSLQEVIIPQARMQTQSHSSKPSLPMQISLLNLRPRDRRLFDRYIHYVTDQLSPLAGFVCSAYAAIVPGIAISNQITPHSAPHATAAVFHGILGVAAASLSVDSPSEGLEALHHETLALQHLRLGIEEGRDAHLPLAVAIMLLLLFEHISGRDHEYRAHIQAGLRCLVLAAQRNSHDSTVAAISEQFLLGCALGNVVPELPLDCLRKQVGNGKRWYFEAKAGMEAGMLEIINEIHEINHAGGHVSSHRAEELRRRLTSCEPVREKAEAEEAYGTASNRGTAALLFTAAELYFARVVQKLEANHPDVLWLMDKGLGQLEGIRPMGERLNNCITSWVGYLLGSECVLEKHQARFMAWCQSMASYPPANTTGPQNVEALIMVARCSWEMKRAAPEKYRLLWYQIDRSGDEIMFAGKTKREDSSDGLATISPLMVDSNLKEILKRSQGQEHAGSG